MRHRSFTSTMRHVAREIARAERARQREHAKLEAAKIRSARHAVQQARANAKEAAKLYVKSRIDEAAELSHDIQERENSITNLLVQALKQSPTIDPLEETQVFEALEFDDAPWASKLPDVHDFLPPQPDSLLGCCLVRLNDMKRKSKLLKNAIGGQWQLTKQRSELERTHLNVFRRSKLRRNRRLNSTTGMCTKQPNNSLQVNIQQSSISIRGSYVSAFGTSRCSVG